MIKEVDKIKEMGNDNVIVVVDSIVMVFDIIGKGLKNLVYSNLVENHGN